MQHGLCRYFSSVHFWGPQQARGYSEPVHFGDPNHPLLDVFYVQNCTSTLKVICKVIELWTPCYTHKTALTILHWSL